jgi:hypothetical protein
MDRRSCLSCPSPSTSRFDQKARTNIAFIARSESHFEQTRNRRGTERYCLINSNDWAVGRREIHGVLTCHLTVGPMILSGICVKL